MDFNDRLRAQWAVLCEQLGVDACESFGSSGVVEMVKRLKAARDSQTETFVALAMALGVAPGGDVDAKLLAKAKELAPGPRQPAALELEVRVLRERLDALTQKVAGHELRLDALEAAPKADPFDTLPRRDSDTLTEAFLSALPGPEKPLGKRLRAGCRGVAYLVRYEAKKGYRAAFEGTAWHAEVEKGDLMAIAGRLDRLVGDLDRIVPKE